jgi:FkbM family methyltransferase
MKQLIKKVANALGYEIRRQGVYPRHDPFSQQKALLKGVTDPVIFDVGASVGSVTGLYRQLWPNATIHAFEPFLESFRTLKATFASDRLIHAHQFGFAERVGSLSLNVNNVPDTNSLFPSDAAGSFFWGKTITDTIQQVEVEISTVDAFCQTNGIAHVDLLKIDTQGAEARVLQGSEAMLREKRISCVYLEIILVPTYQGQAKFHEILKLLDDRSYSLFSIYNLVYRPWCDRLLQFDAIFTATESGTAHAGEGFTLTR